MPQHTPQTPVRAEAEPTPRPLRPPPPMRVVTKGWFTMREEAKTLEELQAADQRDGSE